MSDNVDNNELPTLQDLAIDATGTFVVVPSPTPASQEDIIMSDDNEQASSILSANQHTQPSPVFDLNTFSAMTDADDESDSELTSGLEEAITTKKHDLSTWSKLYRRTLLKMHKNPLDVNYQMWQKEAIQLLEVVRQKTADCARLSAALALDQPMAPIITNPTATMATAIRVDSKKLTLDSGTPRFGDNKHGKGQSYQVIRDPHLFLDGFKTYCENNYGETPFLASAQRLLCMAILDDQTRQQFTDELTRHSSSSLTWEECEVAFVDSVLTPTERFNTVARVAEIGRRHKESYRNFALRLQRSVRVYRIDDNNATVLSGIVSSIPSVELNLIKTSIQKIGTSLSEVKLDSICEILTNLSVMEGPDDSLKRPHSLVDDDEDDKDASSSKTSNNHGHKRQRHRKNDRRGKGKPTADSSSFPSSSNSGKKTFHCDNHGENYSHDTKNCRHCTKCNKNGHTAPYCNSDRKKNFDSKGGKSYKNKKEDK
ncbi:hypothetical protein KI688_001682 [Linnemannia hyalina]|uniref:Uncharacterized protein n=1 Tax=Linnemannia hyalina TaxID=64524 RepID=A0A9P7XSQ5_9FUNG|nr:hypothetical protein KI688_001682 [Linnemannia hyalina]